jgi:hypothetical protein
MTDVPAARFEDLATERGSRGILDAVSAFVERYGVAPVDRARIRHTLTAILGVAAGHGSSRTDSRIAVVADVMPGDVQLVLRLSGDDTTRPLEQEPLGGLEMWISFPRD